MLWTVTPVVLVMFTSTLIAVTVGGLALRWCLNRVAGALVVTMLAVATWAITDAISLGYTELDAILFWRSLELVETAAGSVLYFERGP